MFCRKLKAAELENLLDRLTSYFFRLPGHTRAQSEEQEARTRLTLLRAKLSEDSHVEVSGELSEWLREYLTWVQFEVIPACVKVTFIVSQ